MRAILMAAFAVVASTAAQAQDSQSVTIRQGQQTVLQLSDPFNAVTVGDSSMVDALPRSDRVIVLQGKQPGRTDLLLFDGNNRSRQITVTVQPVIPVVAGDRGLVLTHNKEKVSDFSAYVCENICRRVKSEFEGRDSGTNYQVIESHNVNENTNTTK